MSTWQGSKSFGKVLAMTLSRKFISCWVFNFLSQQNFARPCHACSGRRRRSKARSIGISRRVIMAYFVQKRLQHRGLMLSPSLNSATMAMRTTIARRQWLGNIVVKFLVFCTARNSFQKVQEYRRVRVSSKARSLGASCACR